MAFTDNLWGLSSSLYMNIFSREFTVCRGVGQSTRLLHRYTSHRRGCTYTPLTRWQLVCIGCRMNALGYTRTRAHAQEQPSHLPGYTPKIGPHGRSPLETRAVPASPNLPLRHVVDIIDRFTYDVNHQFQIHNILFQITSQTRALLR